MEIMLKINGWSKTENWDTASVFNAINRGYLEYRLIEPPRNVIAAKYLKPSENENETFILHYRGSEDGKPVFEYYG